MAGIWLLVIICIFLHALDTIAFNIHLNSSTVNPGDNIEISWNGVAVDDDTVTLTVTPALDTISTVILMLSPVSATATVIQIPSQVSDGTYAIDAPELQHHSQKLTVARASNTTTHIVSTTGDGTSTTAVVDSISTSTTVASTTQSYPGSTSSMALSTSSASVSISLATQNATTTAPQSRMSLPKGAIAGIAVGGFAFCVILLGLLFCLYRRYIRSYKKRSNSPIVHITHTHSSSVDPFMVDKISGRTSLERKGILNDTSRATTPSEYSDSHGYRYQHDTLRDHLRAGTHDVAGSMISSDSDIPPEYPALGVNNPYSKYLGKEKEKLENDEDSYGSLTSQQMEELNEQRKKMRELIEVMKERRNSATSGGKVGDLEDGPASPVRGLGL